MNKHKQTGKVRSHLANSENRGVYLCASCRGKEPVNCLNVERRLKSEWTELRRMDEAFACGVGVAVLDSLCRRRNMERYSSSSGGGQSIPVSCSNFITSLFLQLAVAVVTE